MLRILMGLAALALLAIPAQAADYYYGGESYAGVPYRTHFHRLPVCDEAAVLAKVTNKFAYLRRQHHRQRAGHRRYRQYPRDPAET